MVLRYLLRNWLFSLARRSTAEHHHVPPGAAEQTQELAPPPPPCLVGMVFALGIEAGCTEDRLEKTSTVRGHGRFFRQGTLAGRSATIVRSGAGADQAAAATEALIAGHRPLWVLSAGFAGALTPDLARHDFLIVDNLVNVRGDHLSLDLKVDRESLRATPHVHVGRLLTADAVVRLPEEKAALGRRHQALAVDLESFAVAAVCRERGVRFMGVRIISDPLDEILPAEVRQYLDQATAAGKLGSLVGSLWRRPGAAKDLWQLKENALLASDRLAEFLAGIVRQLDPAPLAERES